MYCKNCGKEVSDNAVICIHCGCSITNSSVTSSNLTGESKTGLGALLGVFLGLIGLIIGLLMFPANTNERTTFMKGWGIAFGISVGIIVLFYIIGIVALGAALY